MTTYSAELKGKQWAAFRAAYISRHPKCAVCGKNTITPHHLRYIVGLKPWQYQESDLEPLCRACHADVHGKLDGVPRFGWKLIDWIDNEEVCENCELCGTDIRYSFFVVHPEIEGVFQIGSDCCDKITDVEAWKKLNELKRAEKYRLNATFEKHFNRLGKPLYKIKGIRFDGFKFNILEESNKFRLIAIKENKKPLFGRMFFNTIQDAMNRAGLIYAKNQNPFGKTC